MSEPVSAHELSCPYCGARNERSEARCWLCRQPLSVEAAENQPILAEAVDARPQFALSSLLLVMTLICISLGLVAAAPGLIVPLVIIVIPALIRSVAASRAAGGQISVGGRIANFVVSLGIVVAIWMAGLVALFAAFMLICFGAISSQGGRGTEQAIVVFAVVGLIGAGVTMIWLYYVTWPRRKRR
ncbi:MAG: hypothetical protein DWQ37_13605 [Planctomycetota bacterium]|nr:MAG: hypothetical protein DWQ37_13605 [Planctomycetota bacterium]